MRTGGKALLHTLLQGKGALGRADGAFLLRRHTGHKYLPVRVIMQLAARLRKQMHGRGKTAAHQQGIALLDPDGRHIAIGADTSQRCGIDAQAPKGLDHHMACQNRNGQSPCRLDPRPLRILSEIHNRHDRRPRLRKINRGLIGRIISRKHQHGFADQGTIAV